MEIWLHVDEYLFLDLHFFDYAFFKHWLLVKYSFVLLFSVVVLEKIRFVIYMDFSIGELPNGYLDTPVSNEKSVSLIPVFEDPV